MCKRKMKRSRRFFLQLFLFMAVFAVSAAAQNTSQAKKTAKEPFLYVAIGNSITVHPVCDFWFYKCGMAASSPSKDYVHRTLERLKKKYKDQFHSFRCRVLNAPAWEMDRASRKNTRKKIEKLLKKKPALFTFQYGETSWNCYAMEEDLTSLVRFIQKKSPSTKIVIIGNFWLRDMAQIESDQIKKRVAAACKVGFADLSAIADLPQYEKGFSRLRDPYGGIHQITNSAVAAHPNDRGMDYIAGKIVKEYKRLVKEEKAKIRKEREMNAAMNKATREKAEN